MTPSPEEQQLVRQVLRGDIKAQRRLYDRYVQAMYNTVIRLTSHPMDAEDIVQEAFIKVFLHLDQFNGASTLGAWIKRIMINTTLNFLRRRRPFDQLEMDIPDGPAPPFEPYEPPLDLHRVHEAVKNLPAGCRVVFSLYLLEGYQHQEIAQILDISESTSKSQYQRARRLLREQLSDGAEANVKKRRLWR